MFRAIIGAVGGGLERWVCHGPRTVIKDGVKYSVETIPYSESKRLAEERFNRTMSEALNKAKERSE